eukprot:TRINITY_DN2903_c0_g1_i1.p1 TRINITY_DN2903_c0_g1~~TRINITY_DN2903_c0_g1_i1.p1  ORF type:complete len:150 (+),score=19.35 TRINITY_DN2903_c0_g1_i1:50-499(+)
MAALQATCAAVGAVRCAPLYERKQCVAKASSGHGVISGSSFRLREFCKLWRRKGMDARLTVNSFPLRKNGLESKKRGGNPVAVFGGGDNPEKKKFITKEEEPEQYWSSEGEKSGKSPLSSPLAWIGIISIFFPFILLGVAFSAGLVKLP